MVQCSKLGSFTVNRSFAKKNLNKIRYLDNKSFFSGGVAKKELIKSKLPASELGKIWKLADVDRFLVKTRLTIGHRSGALKFIELSSKFQKFNMKSKRPLRSKFVMAKGH